jgi:reactive intermediate/imine deaminase
MRVVSRLVCALLIGGCTPDGAGRSAPEYYPVSGGRPLPFSEAVRVGDLLHLSGQVGTDSTGKLVAGGIGPETRQTLENIRAVLARHGGSMDDVVKCTAILADMREWAAMNEVYVTYFKAHLPARTAFGAAGLVMGARLELDCIARLRAP